MSIERLIFPTDNAVVRSEVNIHANDNGNGCKCAAVLDWNTFVPDFINFRCNGLIEDLDLDVIIPKIEDEIVNISELIK